MGFLKKVKKGFKKVGKSVKKVAKSTGKVAAKVAKKVVRTAVYKPTAMAMSASGTPWGFKGAKKLSRSKTELKMYGKVALASGKGVQLVGTAVAGWFGGPVAAAAAYRVGALNKQYIGREVDRAKGKSPRKIAWKKQAVRGVTSIAAAYAGAAALGVGAFTGLGASIGTITAGGAASGGLFGAKTLLGSGILGGKGSAGAAGEAGVGGEGGQGQGGFFGGADPFTALGLTDVEGLTPLGMGVIALLAIWLLWE